MTLKAKNTKINFRCRKSGPSMAAPAVRPCLPFRCIFTNFESSLDSTNETIRVWNVVARTE